MEHSLLHALQLAGLIVALGGPVFVLGLLRPACRRLGPEPARDTLAGALSDGAARWVAAGALTAGLATFLDLFVQAAEIQGQTLVRRRRAGARRPLRDGDHLRTAGARCASPVSCWRRRRPGCAAHAGGASIAVLGAGALGCTGLTSHAAAQPTGRMPAIAAQLVHLGAAAGVDRRPRAPPRGASHHHRAHELAVSRAARRDRPARLADGPGGCVSAARFGCLRRGAPSPHAARTW